ncbi:cytochrome P450, family 71, subfamily B, polypeptide 36 [Prunus dulcis]|uniref:Cytochrome P450, family 71, subfamily B, polypeptide 36 n=1 Tax=Prunus dulcis TaxID=3755 RepID=A0A5H2XGC3_PRUDU|nr:cytochrome P450, family 71, subfamily B, polypeptide 36 [Prunus dulcis]
MIFDERLAAQRKEKEMATAELGFKKPLSKEEKIVNKKERLAAIEAFPFAFAIISGETVDNWRWFPQRILDILLEDDDIEEALNLLDQASSERNKLDTLLFNTILEKPVKRYLIRSKEQYGSRYI